MIINYGIYINSEGIYEVGTYDHEGKFESIASFKTSEEAKNLLLAEIKKFKEENNKPSKEFVSHYSYNVHTNHITDYTQKDKITIKKFEDFIVT